MQNLLDVHECINFSFMIFEVDKGLSQSNTIKEKNETKTSVSNNFMKTHSNAFNLLLE